MIYIEPVPRDGSLTDIQPVDMVKTCTPPDISARSTPSLFSSLVPPEVWHVWRVGDVATCQGSRDVCCRSHLPALTSGR